jgi:hypothetical protein
MASNSELFKNIGYDSIIYGITKFGLHKGVPMVHNVSVEDVVIYAVSDFAYKKWVDSAFNDVEYFENKSINNKIERFIALSIETSLIMYLLDKRSNIMGNIAAIGLSEGVQIIIDDLKKK